MIARCSFLRLSDFFSVAGRTILNTILRSLERISFDGDPLQFLLIESTYQPLISVLHMAELNKDHPELQGLRESFEVFGI